MEHTSLQEADFVSRMKQVPVPDSGHLALEQSPARPRRKPRVRERPNTLLAIQHTTCFTSARLATKLSKAHDHDEERQQLCGGL